MRTELWRYDIGEYLSYELYKVKKPGKQNKYFLRSVLRSIHGVRKVRRNQVSAEFCKKVVGLPGYKGAGVCNKKFRRGSWTNVFNNEEYATTKDIPR